MPQLKYFRNGNSLAVGLEFLHCIYHFEWLVLTTKVSTKCSYSVYISALRFDKETSTFIMCYIHYYRSPCKFYCICDNSSTFRLFNIIISLFLLLVSLMSFKEVIRIQNLFKIQFYFPLESHYIELLRTKQISGYHVAHQGNIQRLNCIQTDCHLWINFSVVVLRKTTFIFVKGNFMIKKTLNNTNYSYTLLRFIELIKLYIESKV